MRSITIRQPWASLLVRGIKTIETRSWHPGQLGPFLIHAAKRKPEIPETVTDDDYRLLDLITTSFPDGPESLPTCSIIGSARIASCFATDKLSEWDRCPETRARDLASERLTGDFSRGRWLWLCSDFYECAPVAATGRLGSWNFEISAQHDFGLLCD